MGRLSFGLVAFLFFLVINSYYIVDEAQQAIIVQFGKPMGDAKRDAGLYFKTPTIWIFRNVILNACKFLFKKASV